jgi:serine/threonine protein kinase
MVMEYCNRGNLNAKVSDSPHGVMSIQETFYIVSDVIKGL